MRTDEKFLNPLYLDLLLFYATCANDYATARSLPEDCSAVYNEGVQYLLGQGLISHESDIFTTELIRDKFNCTEKGKAHIDYLISRPFPVQVWAHEH